MSNFKSIKPTKNLIRYYLPNVDKGSYFITTIKKGNKYQIEAYNNNLLNASYLLKSHFNFEIIFSMHRYLYIIKPLIN